MTPTTMIVGLAALTIGGLTYAGVVVLAALAAGVAEQDARLQDGYERYTTPATDTDGVEFPEVVG